VTALDRSGEPIHLGLAGFPAVAAQHECDHLDGVLYVDRLVPQTLMFEKEHSRYGDDYFDDGEE
jgi:peptide deformylase